MMVSGGWNECILVLYLGDNTRTAYSSVYMEFV